MLALIAASPVLPMSPAAAAPVNAAPPVTAAAPLTSAPPGPGQRLEAVIERYNAVRADLRATRLRAAAASARLTAVAQQVDVAERDVASLSASAYRVSLLNPAVVVLSAGSPADAIDRMSTLDILARDSQDRLGHLRQLSRDLATDRWALSQLAATQRAQQDELARLRSSIERQLSTVARATRSAPRRPAPVAVRPPREGPGPAGAAVRFAYRQLGKPYAYATAGPATYDCSGLTMAAWSAAGVALPHNAARQYGAVSHVARGQLRPGDLVFYYAVIQHVAIYVGGGTVIHAPEPGQTVRLQDMDYGPIHGYGRPG
jgi:cell wall-associated NlpC family hydrolase